jgi:hypothetical protein
MLGFGDVIGGKRLRVAYVHQHRALFAQGLSLFWRDAFEFGHGWLLCKFIVKCNAVIGAEVLLVHQTLWDRL